VGLVGAQQRAVDKLTADVRRLQEMSLARTQAWREAGAALQNAEEWLKNGRPHGVTLQDFEAEPVKLTKSENTLLDAIENRRRRVRELRADLNRIESSCYPSSYCKARMREMVEQTAQRGAVDVSGLIEHDDKIMWPMMRVQSQVFNVAQPGAVAFGEVPDIAMFVWLHKEALIKKLDAEIDAENDDSASMTHEERQLRIAEVEGDLLSVERDESFCVWQAQAQNLPCEHRADINPVALLSLRLIATPRATLGSSSSPEHAFVTFVGGPGR
jgi:hypothetical protein